MATKRQAKAPQAPETLSRLLSRASDTVSALESERDDYRHRLAKLEHDSAQAYAEVQQERNELREQRDEWQAKAAKGYVAPEANPLDPASLSDWRAVADKLRNERDEAINERDERPTEDDEHQALKDKLETAETERDESIEREAVELTDAKEEVQALKGDMIELARWIFSMGGTFADLSGAVRSPEALASIQLAYLGGEDLQNASGERWTSAPAGIFLFHAAV